MFEHLDDDADWFTFAQRRIRAVKNDSQLKDCAGLLDSHQFMALPEHCQQDLLEQYVTKLVEMGAFE